MRKLLLIISLYIGSMVVVHAQPAHCPVPIMSGKWKATQTGSMDLRITTTISDTKKKAPSGASADADVNTSACDGTFILKIRNLAFDMSRAGQLDGEQDGLYFVGTTSAGGMDWKTRLKLLDEKTADGRYGMKFSLNQGSGSGFVGFNMRHQDNLAESGRSECECREQLEKFIDKSIKDAEFWVKAYSNPKFMKHPEGVKKWYAPAYDNLITLMFKGDPGIPYDKAVKILIGEEKIPEEGFEELNAENIQKSNKGGENAGEASVSICGHGIGTEHLKECFWNIGYEATVAHEKKHVWICNKYPLSIPSKVENFAFGEVQSYAEEAKFLKEWIPKNCN